MALGRIICKSLFSCQALFFYRPRHKQLLPSARQTPPRQEFTRSSSKMSQSGLPQKFSRYKAPMPRARTSEHVPIVMIKFAMDALAPNLIHILQPIKAPKTAPQEARTKKPAQSNSFNPAGLFSKNCSTHFHKNRATQKSHAGTVRIRVAIAALWPQKLSASWEREIAGR